MTDWDVTLDLMELINAVHPSPNQRAGLYISRYVQNCAAPSTQRVRTIPDLRVLLRTLPVSFENISFACRAVYRCEMLEFFIALNMVPTPSTSREWFINRDTYLDMMQYAAPSNASLHLIHYVYSNRRRISRAARKQLRSCNIGMIFRIDSVLSTSIDKAVSQNIHSDHPLMLTIDISSLTHETLESFDPYIINMSYATRENMLAGTTDEQEIILCPGTLLQFKSYERVGRTTEVELKLIHPEMLLNPYDTHRIHMGADIC
jgi:hypothetical protein